MQCRIESINHKGEGVARIDGKATFIPGVIPGELIDADILQSKARYNLAICRNIVESSPDRITPECTYYTQCSCNYQHLNYQRELELKQQIVKDSLKRIGSIDFPVCPVIGSDKPWRYRNKVVFHCARHKLGYYQPSSHNLVPLDSCLLISEEMEKAVKALKKVLSSLDFIEPGEITLRQSASNHQLMLIIKNLRSYPSKKLLGPLTEICSSVYAGTKDGLKLLFGCEYLIEDLNGICFKVSPESFFQVNHQQNQKIIELVISCLGSKGNEDLLDAYCGVGSITLNIAKQARSVLGIENNSQAIEDARQNCVMNGITNCDFLFGSCEKILPDLNRTFDAAVIDPPRVGCRYEVIAALAACGANKIVYVSCNPSTLTRDLALFADKGYQVRHVQPVDMFPRTMHVETVVLIERE